MPDIQAEPRVSVHGIPKSQYDSMSSPSPVQGGTPVPTAGGGGIIGSIRNNWELWTVGLGIATILVIIMINRSQILGKSAGAQNGANSSYGTGNSSPDQLWGSQLDADYQQLQYMNNTQVGILQQILNKIGNPSNNPPGGPPVNPPVPPGSNPNSYPTTAEIRDRFSEGEAGSYDSIHSEGIPIRNNPGINGGVKGYLGYDQRVTLTGPFIQGSSNFAPGGQSQGSDLWAPLSGGGYVSAYDLTNLSHMLPEVHTGGTTPASHPSGGV